MAEQPQRIAIFGSTGSIGTSALDVISRHPDRLQVSILCAGRNRERLLRQAQQHQPRALGIDSAQDAHWLRERTQIPVFEGARGRRELAQWDTSDQVLMALVGSAGLEPTIAAIRSGKQIALANKETLVAGGALVMREAQRAGIQIRPVDSEHSAAWQCIQGHCDHIERIILTASGGALRDWPLENICKARPEDALAHPNWDMGAKITIDSATMMNKGLELIEAHWLFDMPAERLDAIIHPQSIVHALVEYRDGAQLAHMGMPDMRAPIAYALLDSQRHPVGLEPLRLDRIGRLDFLPPCPQRYPCLRIARAVLASGDESAGVVLNAANEIAVAAFLEHRIRFGAIPALVEETLSAHRPQQLENIDQIHAIDDWSRRITRQQLKEHRQ